MEPEAYINKIKDFVIAQPLRIVAENIRRLAARVAAVEVAISPSGLPKLDDLNEPDDNTDLNASTSKHGLMQKYPGGGTNYLREDGTWATPSGTGAPTSAKYIVQQLDATLTNEQAIGDLATGILKGTTGTGVISIAVDADFPATLARDTEVTAAIAAHEALADPHTVYQKESEKGAASGYASLDGSTLVPIAQIPVISIAKGGTGQATKAPAFDALSPTVNPGDLIFRDASANVKLGIGTPGQLLQVNAGGDAPEWATIAGLSVPTGSGFRHVTAGVEDAAAKLVDTADINADQVTFPKIQNIDTARILGRTTAGSGDIEQLTVVPTFLGGTGQTNVTAAFDALSPLTTQGDVLYHDGTDNVRLAKNTSATRYLSNTGASNNPAWAQVDLTNGITGNLPVGNIADGTITLAKIQNISTLRVLGRTTAGSGVIEELTGVPTSLIVNDAVTFAKIQNINSGHLLGRFNAGPGDVEEVLLDTTTLEMPGGVLGLITPVAILDGGTGETTALGAFNAFSPLTTQGDLLYHNGTNNVRLAKNTNSTRYLSNTGSSNNPQWDVVSLVNGVTGDLPFSNIQNIATASLLGRSTAGTGDIEVITTASPLEIVAGELLLTGVISILKGGTGQTTATAAFDALAPTTTEGDIIIHDGTDNIRLAKGPAFRVLAMNAAGTRPRWQRVFSDSTVAQQSVGPSTTAYITGSGINVAGAENSVVRTATRLKWTIAVTKTAAGTANVTMDLRVGTAGTTADTSVQTYTITGASGAADSAIIIIEAVVRDSDATGSLSTFFLLNHNLAATGFHDKATLIGRATTGSIDLTVSNLIFGLSVTTPASTTWNFEHVSVETFNL